MTISAAAVSASLRSSMGVAPAWFASPITFTCRCRSPSIPVTAPTGTLAALQHAALLDVQLDEGVHGVLGLVRRTRRPEPVGVVAVGGDRVAIAHAVGVDERQDVLDGHVARHRRRADRAALEARAFLTDEDRDVDGALGLHPGGVERAQGLERPDDAQRTVEATAARHRVEVRARHDRGRARHRAGAPTDEVAHVVAT